MTDKLACTCPDPNCYWRSAVLHKGSGLSGIVLGPHFIADNNPFAVKYVDSVNIEGNWYRNHGVAANGELDLHPPFKVAWETNFTTSGQARRSGYTVIPDPAPIGWIDPTSSGKLGFLETSVKFDGNEYAVVSHTATSFTLKRAREASVHNVSLFSRFAVDFEIAFTAVGGLLTITDNVVSFSSAPEGWAAGRLVGFQFVFIDASGNAITNTITANTDSTVTLNASPVLNEVGASWKVLRGPAYPTLTTSGKLLSYIVGGTYVLKTDSGTIYDYYDWEPGLFDGLSITYDGITTTVVSNDANSVTVTNPSPAFDLKDWSLNVETSGKGAIVAIGASATPNGLEVQGKTRNWPFFDGMSLLVRNVPHTMDMAAGPIFTNNNVTYVQFTTDVDNTVGSWYTDRVMVEVASGGYARNATTGHYYFTDDGSKVFDIRPAPYQYIITTLYGFIFSEHVRLLFGPGGVCQAYRDGYTFHLECMGYHRTMDLTNIGKEWYGTWSTGAGGYVVIRKPASSNYYSVQAAYASDSSGSAVQCLEVRVPSGDWESAPHKIGLTGDAGIIFGGTAIGSWRWAPTTARAISPYVMNPDPIIQGQSCGYHVINPFFPDVDSPPNKAVLTVTHVHPAYDYTVDLLGRYTPGTASTGYDYSNGGLRASLNGTDYEDRTVTIALSQEFGANNSYHAWAYDVAYPYTNISMSVDGLSQGGFPSPTDHGSIPLNQAVTSITLSFIWA